MEKAVSKVYGSYEDVEKNTASIRDDLYMLTGAPTYDVPLTGENEYKQIIIKGQMNGYQI